MKAWLSIASVLLVGVLAWPVGAQSDFAKAALASVGLAVFCRQAADMVSRPEIPADNPLTEEKVELGRHLFYEPMLSGNSTIACATCHRQTLAFTDGLAARNRR
jgi:cytochrome c peroxidase